MKYRHKKTESWGYHIKDIATKRYGRWPMRVGRLSHLITQSPQDSLFSNRVWLRLPDGTIEQSDIHYSSLHPGPGDAWPTYQEQIEAFMARHIIKYAKNLTLLGRIRILYRLLKRWFTTQYEKVSDE